MNRAHLDEKLGCAVWSARTNENGSRKNAAALNERNESSSLPVAGEMSQKCEKPACGGLQSVQRSGMLNGVPRAGLEPARPLRSEGF